MNQTHDLWHKICVYRTSSPCRGLNPSRFSYPLMVSEQSTIYWQKDGWLRFSPRYSVYWTATTKVPPRTFRKTNAGVWYLKALGNALSLTPLSVAPVVLLSIPNCSVNTYIDCIFMIYIYFHRFENEWESEGEGEETTSEPRNHQKQEHTFRSSYSATMSLFYI